MLGLSAANRTERFLGRLALAIEIVALGVVVTFLLAGLAAGEEIRGNLAYSLMFAAGLVDVGVAIGYGSTIAVQRVTWGAWILVTVATLLLVLYIGSLVDPEASKSADAVLFSTMPILGFPASLASLCFAFVYSALFLTSHGSRAFDLLFFWSLFSIAGYLQWFVLIPFLFRRIKSGHRSGTSP
jgi:hypothetical protein